METFEKDIERKKLKQWVILEEIKQKIASAFKEGKSKTFSEEIIGYITIAFDLEDNIMLFELPWWEILFAFEKARTINRPSLKIPMIINTPKPSREGITETTYAWEYPERLWYSLLHIFSKNYGWLVQYVEELDVDDAMALLQEINIGDQLEREFYYSLSEIAYPYDQNRKAGIFKPMERPEWMREYTKVLAPRKTKIRKDFMPVGLIIGSPKNDTEH